MAISITQWLSERVYRIVYTDPFTGNTRHANIMFSDLPTLLYGVQQMMSGDSEVAADLQAQDDDNDDDDDDSVYKHENGGLTTSVQFNMGQTTSIYQWKSERPDGQRDHVYLEHADLVWLMDALAKGRSESAADVLDDKTVEFMRGWRSGWNSAMDQIVQLASAEIRKS